MAIMNSLQDVLSYFEAVSFDEKTVSEIESGLNVRIIPTDTEAIKAAVATLKAAYKNIEAYNSLVTLLYANSNTEPVKQKRKRRTKAEIEASKA